MPESLAETDWTLGFNDPTLIGWILTAGYVLAAGLSLRAFWMTRKRGARLGRFWLALTILLALLGINKQLDLQTLLLKTGSRIASEFGWGELRHFVRDGFIIIVGLGILAVGAWLFKKRWIYLPRDPWLWSGIALILIFLFIRTPVFDAIFRTSGFWSDRHDPHFLELAGLLALIWGISREARPPRE